MKLLALILMFVIAAQPVGAGFCDMESAGETADHTAMSQHGATQENDSHSGHDCCDPGLVGDNRPASDCNFDMDCGFCVAGMSAVAPLPNQLSFWLRVYRSSAILRPLITRHTSPPFRPPISVS